GDWGSPEALGRDRAWRLSVHGHTSVLAPAARARRLEMRHEAYVRELRDLLATLVCNLGDDALDCLLPALLMGSAVGVLERTARTASLDIRSFHVDLGADGGGYPIPASRPDAGHLVAFRDLALRLPQLRDRRQDVQARRERPDEAILSEFRPYRRPAPWSTRAVTTVAESLGATELLAAAPRRVLVFTSEVLPYPGL